MALAIDFALIAAINFLLFFLSAAWLASLAASLELPAVFIIGGVLFVVVNVSFIFVHLVYSVLFHALFGQTIGKMVMAIRVVTEEDKLISPGAAFLRWTGYLLSLLPLAAGFLWAAVDRDHCAWHDRLARTRVVSVEMT